jgi:hypothetical protein
MSGKPETTGGFRLGAGRPKGSKNKATLERIAREKIAEQVATEIGIPAPVASIALQRAIEGRRLAKDEIKEAIPMIKEIVEFCKQQASAQNPKTGKLAINPEADLSDLKDWLRLFVDTCFKLAAFESPTFKAIAVAEVPQMGAQPADPGKVLDLQAERDPQSADQTYLRLVKAPRDARAA